MTYLLLELVLGLVLIPICVLIVSALLEITVYAETCVLPETLRVVYKMCAVSVGAGVIILIICLLIEVLNL